MWIDPWVLWAAIGFWLVMAFVVRLVRGDPAKIRGHALDERFSGFAHGINSALKAGFAIKGFEGGDLPACHLVYAFPNIDRCSMLQGKAASEEGTFGTDLDWNVLEDVERALPIAIKFSGPKRGSLYVHDFRRIARRPFNATRYGRLYGRLSGRAEPDFYEVISPRFFADIIADFREWAVQEDREFLSQVMAECPSRAECGRKADG